ncbi:hypothetical protein SUGI_0093680 [Cryptomeria japonica]|nr:hypothetical protein SUGI_0093680 [Cryptomeria japonica]
MVTNVELAKKVEDQEEENRVLRERLDQLAMKLAKVEVKTEEVHDKVGDQGKIMAIEDEVPMPDPVIEKEPFLKALRAMSGKTLEGVALFSGKMDLDALIEWIEGLENHFECDRVTEAQKVKLEKSRLRGAALTWWKFIQEERVKEGKQPIAT